MIFLDPKISKDKEMRQDTKSFTLLERKPRHLRRGLHPRRTSPTGFTHIKEVVDNIFTTSPLKMNLDDVRIWKLWDGVVGKRIAEHARPSWIKKGVLMVKVTDSVWLQDLEFMAEMIKEKLNSRLQREAIRKIRFKVGESTSDRKTTLSKYRREDL
ncbi:MAG: DUF721 domain-containing protein [Desulfobacterales bacterium]|nr:DUF721 domain-containing protein [Desulfobacterales bacterium]